MMNYDELLKKRRAIRDFLDQEVPLPVVEDILRDATLAPSASNNQPCRFAVVQCRKAIKNLSDESKACLLHDHSDKKVVLKPEYVNLLEDENFNVFYNAPCLIFVAGPKTVRSLDVDAALAVAYIMFAAAAQGLGTCWVALGSNIRDPKLRGELGLSENLRIVAPILLGYPRTIPAASERHAPEILRVITQAR
jgi:nitroreductase